MLVLLVIGFLAGVITAISPCVLPVLPIVFAGGASGGRRRPYAIIAGLVGSFFFSVLFVAWVLHKVGLPQDLLRNIAIGLLFLVAVTLIVPRAGELIERPLLRLTRRRGGDLGGGFLLGVSLGLVFVPCGGPILGYISAQAASVNFGAKTILLTLAYALGAAVPMLLIALGGRRATGALRVFRTHAYAVRAALGVVMAAGALLIAFNVDRTLQTKVGDYTAFLQRHTEKTCAARKQLGHRCRSNAAQLADLGTAPNFRGNDAWINTPDGKPLSIHDLRGKVVLVDFWTYSCINCLRTLPHLKAWYAAYHRKGLEIVGVHTPEFAFEHVLSNVRKAVHDLGVHYPVALDNEYKTWNAYGNEAWPTEYLIDRRGVLRERHEGEGSYGQTEREIRHLLGAPGRPELAVADRTPTEILTPETYLGYGHYLERYWGSQIVPDRLVGYRFKRDLPQNAWGYDGFWRVSPQGAMAGDHARLRLHFYATDVYIVMGGNGRVRVLLNGKQRRVIDVSGIPKLYTALTLPLERDALLELRFTPGIAVYSFTFG